MLGTAGLEYWVILTKLNESGPRTQFNKVGQSEINGSCKTNYMWTWNKAQQRDGNITLFTAELFLFKKFQKFCTFLWKILQSPLSKSGVWDKIDSNFIKQDESEWFNSVTASNRDSISL